MIKVFVDGQTGTTGLEINERLKKYDNIELLKIEYEKRYDLDVKKEIINSADVVFLCLPDDAAIESAGLVTNGRTKIIDPSTAHRTSIDWAYGLPELSKEHREKIRGSHKITNPGCHATAFVLSVYPLVKEKVILPQDCLTCQSLTGYSGGGKALIEKYEGNGGVNAYTQAPRHYALNLGHKHLPEMALRAELEQLPVFWPILGNFYKGLVTTVPIHTKHLAKKMNAKDLHELLSEHYCEEKFVKVMPYCDQESLMDGGFDAMGCNDTNRAEIFVYGNEANHSALIMTRIDNLGKGASGAAIQNMNLLLGFDETLHLV